MADNSHNSSARETKVTSVTLQPATFELLMHVRLQVLLCFIYAA